MSKQKIAHVVLAKSVEYGIPTVALCGKRINKPKAVTDGRPMCSTCHTRELEFAYARFASTSEWVFVSANLTATKPGEALAA